jgi:hypothetical protein
MSAISQYNAWRIRRNNLARKLADGLGAFAPNLVVSAGDYCKNVGLVYQAQNSGTTGANGPTQTTGLSNDGGVSWLFVEARALLLLPTPLPTIS